MKWSFLTASTLAWKLSIKRSLKRSGDHGAAIAIGSQIIFQIEIGIAIAISISNVDRDRDCDLNFGDRGHALGVTEQKSTLKTFLRFLFFFKIQYRECICLQSNFTLRRSKILAVFSLDKKPHAEIEPLIALANACNPTLSFGGRNILAVFNLDDKPPPQKTVLANAYA